jgi:integrase
VRLDDHQFWTPLIMLFSGARPSEIAQLAVTDVKLGRDHPHISILTEYDPDDPNDRPYVLAYKTENARRTVPLHPQLIELGFASYVERMRKEGHERLFPHWRASNDPRKLYSGATWVRRFNDKCVPAITKKKPKPSIYSLRHTFKTQMAICRVPPQFQDRVMGHAGPGMDPTYLKTIPIRELYAEIEKVRYVGLDLSGLRR